MAGIYIHIPFCKQACTYCDFHFSTSTGLKKQFLYALKKEIALTADFIPYAETIDSIYFGGGTPSLLDFTELTEIFSAIQKKFNVSMNAEITLEANPDDINKQLLQHWLSMGINRLSLGIQSFNEEELRWMNRAHTAADSRRSIDEITDAGFSNFSADLIFGSPFLTDEGLLQNLELIISKKIPHLSCYALTVEPKTVLSKLIRQKKSLPVSGEKQARQFLLLAEVLSRHGYEHYEISNFSLPGKRSKHNSSYWQGTAYYGFGPSAHSFNGLNKRRWNVANNALYIQSLEKDMIPFEEETLTHKQRMNEYIMTSLRTAEGISMKIIELEFSEQTNKIHATMQQYMHSGKVMMQHENYILTTEGKLFADGIAAALFF